MAEIDLDLVDTLWTAIKAERDRRSNEGGYRVGDYWFHSDAKSRSQQYGLVRRADRVEAAGGDMDAPITRADGSALPWKTMSGVYVPMTPRLAQQIFDAAEAQEIALHQAAEAARFAMTADPEGFALTAELFPAVFGEAR